MNYSSWLLRPFCLCISNLHYLLFTNFDFILVNKTCILQVIEQKEPQSSSTSGKTFFISCTRYTNAVTVVILVVLDIQKLLKVNTLYTKAVTSGTRYIKDVTTFYSIYKSCYQFYSLYKAVTSCNGYTKAVTSCT